MVSRVLFHVTTSLFVSRAKSEAEITVPQISGATQTSAAKVHDRRMAGSSPQMSICSHARRLRVRAVYSACNDEDVPAGWGTSHADVGSYVRTQVSFSVGTQRV